MGTEMRYYLAAFLKKVFFKIGKPRAFSHVSWAELLIYTVKQGVQLWQGPVRTCMASYRYVDECDAAITTPYGTLFVPRSLDITALRYLLRETLDPHHWHHFDNHDTPITSGDVVVDCGASEGLWALTIINRVKKVYLVEPQDAFIRVLRKTFAPMLAAGVAEIIPYAIGATDGTCTLVCNGDADVMASIDPRRHGSVTLCRFDTLFAERRIDFIKADIEGAEMDLLQGAAESIRRWQPKIAIAVYHPANDWKEMRDFIHSCDSSYAWKLTGMTAWGKPLMLHMWVPDRKKSHIP
ncbi:MAG: FkbM family methyltransferase [Desulfobacterota bacterium]|nr:FkbM family methyltransferase [Thermodesulfobacteriota bacterium]